MNSDIEDNIELFEFEWWSAFLGYVSLIIITIALIFVWFNLHGLVHPANQPRMFIIFFMPALSWFYFLPRFINLFAIPKTIIFKENSIIVISPLNQKRVFAYEDVSRFVIQRTVKPSRPSPFMARLFFSNDTIKVMFDPKRSPNLPRVLQTITDKGLGQVIEREW